MYKLRTGIFNKRLSQYSEPFLHPKFYVFFLFFNNAIYLSTFDARHRSLLNPNR